MHDTAHLLLSHLDHAERSRTAARVRAAGLARRRRLGHRAALQARLTRAAGS